MQHTAEVRIDLDAVSTNVAEIRRFVGQDRGVMAMVKADGYGHGGVAIARHLERLGVAAFGVAHVDEALALRAGGVAGSITVFQPDFQLKRQAYYQHDLQAVIASPEDMAYLSSGQKIECHLMVDTGMGREGVMPSEFRACFAAVMKEPQLHLVGLGTHFACADEPNDDKTLAQVACFESLLETIDPATRETVTVHAANSGAIINYPQAHYQMVRPGIMLYGQYQGVGTVQQQAAMSVYARLVARKRLPAGSTVGYGATYRAESDLLVGLLSLGYGDGFLRTNANHGFVWYGDECFPVLGRVSMDQISIDLKGRDYPLGAEFKIVGGEVTDPAGIGQESDRNRTIAYERCCQLGLRLPRVYLGGEAEANHEF